MKNLFIIAALLCFNSAFAQDYCKQIKKEVTENNTSFSYETPYIEDNPPAIRAVRNYSTSTENEFDNFNIVLYLPCDFGDLLAKNADGMESEKQEKTVVLEFDDKTRITDDTTMVTHDKKSDGSAARVAYFNVTAQNIKTLTTKKIVKVHLATASQAIAPEVATAMQAYLACLRDVKKM